MVYHLEKWLCEFSSGQSAKWENVLMRPTVRSEKNV